MNSGVKVLEMQAICGPATCTADTVHIWTGLLCVSPKKNPVDSAACPGAQFKWGAL